MATVSVDPATGVVTGSVQLVEPGSTAALTFDPQPHLGFMTVELDGAFTYTPSLAGRLRAGSIAGGTTDTFLVQITGPETVMFENVTVPVPGARLVQRATTVPAPAGRLTVSPDSSRLYLTDLVRHLTVVRTDDGSVRTVAGDGGAGKSEVNRAGTRVYVGRGDANAVTEHDADGTLLRTIPTGRNPFDIALSADGNQLYVSNHDDDTVTVTDLTTLQTRVVLQQGHPWAIELAPDASTLYAMTTASDGRHKLCILDLRDSALTAIDDVPPGHLAVSPDGATVYSIEFHFGAVEVWWLRSLRRAGDVTARTRLLGAVGDIALSPDGSAMFVSHPNEDAIVVVDTAADRVLTTLSVSGKPYGIGVSPDGTRLFASCSEPANVVTVDVVKT